MVRKERKKASDASLLHPPPSVPRERSRACAPVSLRGAMVYPPPAGFDLGYHCRAAGFWGQDRWCRRAETGPCDALRRIDKNLRVGGVMILRDRHGGSTAE